MKRIIFSLSIVSLTILASCCNQKDDDLPIVKRIHTNIVMQGVERYKQVFIERYRRSDSIVIVRIPYYDQYPPSKARKTLGIRYYIDANGQLQADPQITDTLEFATYKVPLHLRSSIHTKEELIAHYQSLASDFMELQISDVSNTPEFSKLTSYYFYLDGRHSSIKYIDPNIPIPSDYPYGTEVIASIKRSLKLEDNWYYIKY